MFKTGKLIEGKLYLKTKGGNWINIICLITHKESNYQ